MIRYIKKFQKAISLLCSTLLLCLLFYTQEITLQELLKVTAELAVYLPLLFLLETSALWLSAFIWVNIARRVFSEFSYRQALKFCYIGMFANNFLPSSVGGDTAKAFFVHREKQQAMHVITSILMHRIVGFTVLLLFAAAGCWYTRKIFPVETHYLLVSVVGVLSTITLVVWIALFSSYPIWKLLPNFLNLRQRCDDFMQDFRKHYKNARLLSVCFGASIVFYVIAITSNWFALRVLGENVQFIHLSVVIPLIYVLTMIPVSFNGIGVREHGYVYFLSLLNVSTGLAITVSLALYFIYLINSTVGGLLFWMETRKAK